MFSRYFPPEDTFVPLPQEEERPVSQPQPAQKTPPADPHPAQGRGGAPRGGPAGDLLGGMPQEISKLLNGVFGKFSLEDLDTGDILLMLIVLFLFLEGDDVDLAIALGLTLLLSFGESQSGSSPPADTAPSHPGG